MLNNNVLGSIKRVTEDEMVISLKFDVIRQMPDPVFQNIKHFIGFIKASDYNKKLPDTPNPRPSDERDLNKAVYKEVINSFLNIECTPNTFHLKSHASKITCDSMKKISNNEYVLTFKGRQGIVDGLHCLNIVYQYKSDSPDQYISLWITVGIPDDFTTEMSQGLNSSMQVALESLLNSDGKFDWIKETLSKEKYADNIAYIETEKCDITIGFIIQLLTLFNIEKYPIDGQDLPLCAYSRKSDCIKAYDKSIDQYKKLVNVLSDILYMHDIIQISAAELYGKGSSHLSFIENKTGDRTFYFNFIQLTSPRRLTSGAVFPILGSFRCLLEYDPSTGNYRWKNNINREGLVKIWRAVGQTLLKSTKVNFDDLGRDANKLGKSSSHWKSILMEFQLLVSRL